MKKLEALVLYPSWAVVREAIELPDNRWTWIGVSGAVADSARLIGVDEHSRHWKGHPEMLEQVWVLDEQRWVRAQVRDARERWVGYNDRDVKVEQSRQLMEWGVDSLEQLRQIEFEYTGQGPAALEYVSNAIKWRAQYELDLNSNRLKGFARIKNQQEGLEVDQFTLIGGDFQQLNPDIRRECSRHYPEDLPPFTASGVFTYPIQQTLRLPVGYTLIKFVEAEPRVRKEVRVEIDSRRLSGIYRAVSFEAPVPLTEGVLRVSEGLYLGEGELKLTPKGARAQVLLGDDAELEVKQESVGWTSEREQWRLTLTNRKAEATVVDLNWEIGMGNWLNLPAGAVRLNPSHFTLELPLQAGEQAVLELENSLEEQKSYRRW